MDFAMDENGDIAIVNGDFYFVTGIDATIQYLNQYLRLFLTEWFLDETQGIPYLDEIFIKNPNPVTIDSIFKAKIIQCPGIIELLAFSLSIDSPTRLLTITGRIRGLDGEADFSLPNISPGGGL